MFSIETIMYFLFQAILVIAIIITVAEVAYSMLHRPARLYFFVEVVVWRWLLAVCVGLFASFAGLGILLKIQGA